MAKYPLFAFIVVVLMDSMFAQLLTQSNYIKAPNAAKDNKFGTSVKISGDGLTMVVGAPAESSASQGINGPIVQGGALNSGAVYVYVLSAGNWTFHSYIKASNAASDNRFGASVALSGNGKTLFVGAPGERSQSSTIDGDQTQGTLPNWGAVYVFSFDGMVWRQSSYLKSPTPGENFYFGSSVSCSFDATVVAVGVPGGRSGIGFVNLFTNSDGSLWQFSFQIVPVKLEGQFGREVSMSGDGLSLAVVQQGGSEWPSLPRFRLFRRTALSGWILHPSCSWDQPGRTEYDLFIGSGGANAYCAINFNGSRAAFGWGDDTLASGVNPSNPSPGGSQASGAVRVYTVSTQKIRIEAFLKASTCYKSSYFGSGLSFSGDGNLLAVGAWGESGGGVGVNGDERPAVSPNSGAVYLFRFRNSTWIQFEYLKSRTSAPNQRFGSSLGLSMDGSYLVVGAPFESGNNSASLQISGAAFTFYDGCDKLVDTSAGISTSVCGSNPVSLNAHSGIGLTGSWNGFAPGSVSSRFDPNALFTPGITQIGTDVILTWTVGECSRSVTISVMRAPVVSATSFDSVMCSSSTMQLQSSFGGSATGGFWSGYAPGTLSPSFPFTVFAPHPSQAGTQVFLTWQSVNPPACSPARAIVNITVLPAAVISVVSPVDACMDVPGPVPLQATLSGSAISGIWSGYAPGTISNATDPFAIFIPASEQLGTTVNLTFSNTNAGRCATFAAPAIVVVRLSRSPCENSARTASFSPAAIAGISIGIVAGVVLAVVGSILLYKKWNASMAKFGSNGGEFSTSYELMTSDSYKF